MEERRDCLNCLACLPAAGGFCLMVGVLTYLHCCCACRIIPPVIIIMAVFVPGPLRDLLKRNMSLYNSYISLNMYRHLASPPPTSSSSSSSSVCLPALCAATTAD